MPTQVAYLGPKGTYAEQAACELAKLEKLDQAELFPLPGLRSVIEYVANKHCEAAVVPIENSVEGGVSATLDALWSNPDLFIKRALVLPIRHALIGSGSLNEISEVLSHPQALAQCSGWLNKNLPNAIQLPTNSTSAAVKMVRGSKFRAAIGSRAMLPEKDITELAYPINDVAGNCTRFILLKNTESSKKGDLASIAFSLKSNTPGALLKALDCIANLGLNMSRIESRPSKRELGEYVFFIDIEIKQKSIDMHNDLLPKLKVFCDHIVHFGTYSNASIEID